MPILFAATIFVSALLLFLIQPMFAKIILPLLGGAPSVWNTAVVFYQLLLLIGYLYAHLVTRRLSLRRQLILHGLLLLLPLLWLPIGIPEGWTPPVDSANPFIWLLALLLLTIGAPFFVVSTSSPLLQAWFARTGHRTATDPYFLYAASNTGSMLALLGYPLLIEPRLTLAQQGRWWALGYASLVLLIGLCGLVLARIAGRSRLSEVPAAPAEQQPALARRRQLRWLLLAFVPSSLMLGLTTYLSVDVSPFPLLWVVPLSIYLLSFILVFAKRQLLPRWLLLRAFPFVVLPLLILILFEVEQPLWLTLPWHLMLLFMVAMICHGQLAADRPPPQQLTTFYLWLSLGGVLGGMFNTLLAPLLFINIVEYPLAIVLACLVLPLRQHQLEAPGERLLDFALPLFVGLAMLLLSVLLGAINMKYGIVGVTILLIAPLMIAAGFRLRPLRFGLTIGVTLLLSGVIYQASSAQELSATRNFFGITQVVATRNYHRLLHNKITHGLQSLDPSRRREPIYYYHRGGALSQTFALLEERQPPARQIAVVGLGTGTIACYGQPGQHWTFYEIDPAVVRVARDPRYFSYLQDCAPHAQIVLGDARLSLTQAPPRHYDLIILDAYSSDAIPVHLLTREALALYLDKLAPQGILIFHLTNNHLRLEPVLAGLAQDAGLSALIHQYRRLRGEAYHPEIPPSDWAVLAHDQSQLVGLLDDERWRPLQSHPDGVLWSDDFSNILSVLKWQ